VFRGSLHPAELVARLVREADLARVDGPDGPVAPNVYAIYLSPKDVGGFEVPEQLNRELERAVEVEAITRGWRLEGPARVWMEAQESVGSGRVAVRTEVTTGHRPAWALLVGPHHSYEITHNRAVIGRGSASDVIVPDDIVSRRHAMIWREGDGNWVVDLGSANGTYVDGLSAVDPVHLANGQRVMLGTIPLLFQQLDEEA
jgi:hypothetical protein